MMNFTSSERQVRRSNWLLEEGCSSSSAATSTGNKNENINGGDEIDLEHMFDKVVTPSDVGKLNRLVIPKQHAEKYFPLDSSANEQQKGLLLNFEDRNGKPWRFRYSYWNSSQSYVMTKGWSRFVKDKKLDAGDIVSFHRGAGESGKHRLFIDWRRRPIIPGGGGLSQFPFHRSIIHHQYPAAAAAAWNYSHYSPYGYNGNYTIGGSGGPSYYYPFNNSQLVVNGNPCLGGYFRSGEEAVALAPPVAATGHYFHQSGGLAAAAGGMVLESVPVVPAGNNTKRLRLFGVNMDCHISDDVVSDEQMAVDDVTKTSSSSSSMPLDLDL